MAQSVRTARDVVVAAAVFLICSPAFAKPAATGVDPFDAARDAEARLDYKAVITNAKSALEQANTHDRLIKLYDLLGTAYGVLGKSDDAADAFTRLLAIDPDHHLPRGMSPKVTRPFKEAGGYWIDRPGGLGVQPTLPHDVSPGKPVAVSVKLDDPLQMTANVRLSWRHEGDPDYVKTEVPTGPTVSFNIPGELVTARVADYNLELFITALGPTGSELRLAGEAAHPLTITVRAPREVAVVTTTTTAPNGTVTVTTEPVAPKKPLIKQWWLWTAVGAVVVVAAVGGGLGYYYSRDTSHVDFSLSSRTGP